MLRIARLCLLLGLSLVAFGNGPLRAQDIVGIEDCTKTTGLDKRTGCLQSNVNYLQRLVNRNAVDAAQKLKAVEAEVVAFKAAVSGLQKAVEQLQAASKPPGDKKTDTK